MDKTAKKLKQKRRAEREKALNAIRQEQEKELLKRFEVVAKKHGIKKFNKKQALLSYKLVENEAISDGTIYTIMFVAWYLHIKYGYNYIRIAQFIDAVNYYSKSTVENKRDTEKLIDEMKRECQFDYVELMSDFDPLKIKTDTSAEDKLKMAVCKMQAILPVTLYVLYFKMGWKKKRMNAVGETAKQVMKEIPKGKLKEIREVLRNDCGMVFYSNGWIDYLKAKE